MTTSPYLDHLRHHYESCPSHTARGQRATSRLLAPWRRQRTYHPTNPPAAR